MENADIRTQVIDEVFVRLAAGLADTGSLSRNKVTVYYDWRQKDDILGAKASGIDSVGKDAVCRRTGA